MTALPENGWDCAKVKRLVIKLGTQVLIGPDGKLASDRLNALIGAAAHLAAQGREIIMVTSGAVGLGRLALNLPGELSLNDKQACAAVGQGLLMNHYRQGFEAHGKVTAQVLLTGSDFTHRQRYLTLQATLTQLLALNVIPIVNENDVISAVELQEESHSKSFGDNDKLSALLATKLQADALIILTNVDGIYTDNPAQNANAQKIDCIEAFEQLLQVDTQGQSALGRGGMTSKVEAARIASMGGVYTIICSGFFNTEAENPLNRLFQVTSTHVGTHILPHRAFGARKHWIGFASGTGGSVIVNPNAKKAIAGQHASLLAVGIIGTQGQFQARQVISIEDENGDEIGRGLTHFSSEEIRRIQGQPSQALAQILDRPDVDKTGVVIHRDNLVIFEEIGA